MYESRIRKGAAFLKIKFVKFYKYVANYLCKCYNTMLEVM